MDHISAKDAANSRYEAEMGDNTPGLALLSESPLPNPVAAGLIAWSPTTDLAATVGDQDSALFIRRPGGETVSKHTERDRKVQALRWKSDGKSRSHVAYSRRRRR